MRIIVKEAKRYKEAKSFFYKKRDLLLNILHLLIYLCLLYESTAECIWAHLAKGCCCSDARKGRGTNTHMKSTFNEAPFSFALYVTIKSMRTSSWRSRNIYSANWRHAVCVYQKCWIKKWKKLKLCMHASIHIMAEQGIFFHSVSVQFTGHLWYGRSSIAGAPLLFFSLSLIFLGSRIRLLKFPFKIYE